MGGRVGSDRCNRTGNKCVVDATVHLIAASCSMGCFVRTVLCRGDSGHSKSTTGWHLKAMGCWEVKVLILALAVGLVNGQTAPLQVTSGHNLQG